MRLYRIVRRIMGSWETLATGYEDEALAHEVADALRELDCRVIVEGYEI